MATFRVNKNKDNPYVMINKEFVKRSDMSMQAKGLLTYFLSLPDDWEIRTNEIQYHFTNGIKAVKTALTELMQQGYIRKTQRRDSSNRFCNAEYDVYEYPEH